jgi:mycothiol synthase
MKRLMKEEFAIPNAPIIPGLTFRRFRGDTDYPLIAALFDACKIIDGLESTMKVEDIAISFRHLENCDPHTDILFAEVDERLIAYGRIWWDDLAEGIRLYHPQGFLHPDWRGKGIGSALWDAAEKRALEIAAGHPKEVPKFFQAEPFDTEKALVALLERCGYQAVRYETHMVRDLSELFPQAPLPPGFEVRPVKPEHVRPIFEASNESFRDHWGTRDQSEEEYRSQVESPDFHPELWKVAWAGDQIASVIHNFILSDENAEYKRKRGYTEGICTRRPWRKLGLARSLLVQSMHMFKEMGMTETALSVDSQNISGACRLYEGVGYRTVRQQTIYRKPME